MYNLPLSEFMDRVNSLVTGHETLPYRLKHAFRGLVLGEEHFTSPTLYKTYLDIKIKYEKIKDLDYSTDEHQYLA